MSSAQSAELGFLGPYRITRRLGIGGTSEVLLAISQGPYGFERTVVIKRLLPRCAIDPALHRMLAAEAVAYARLAHPAIVRLYDFFAPGGQVALVLEYVDGPSLARLRMLMRSKRESLGDPAALFIASRVFSALAAAHSARDPRNGEFAPVIHRDVSPGNVLIPWDGFVKLSDFGVAKVTGVSGDSRSGTLKGTYGYMAPEQVVGERVTPRTDVYAGCLLLRELLLARPAFTQGEMPEFEFLRSMAEPQLEPLERLRSGISRALADALHRGLARDPERRTLTAAEMVHVLRHETDMERAHGALVAKLARVRPNEAPRMSTPPNGVATLSVSPMSTTLRLNKYDIPSTVPDPYESETQRFGLYDTPNSMTVESDPSFPIALGRRVRARHAVAVAAGAAAIVAIGAGWLSISRHKPDAIASANAETAAGDPSKESPAPKTAKVAELATLAPATDVLVPRAAAPIAPIAPSVATPAPPEPPVVIASRAPAVKGANGRGAPGLTPWPLPAPGGPGGSALGDIVTPASARGHRVFVDGQFAAPDSGVTLHVKCGRHTVRIGSSGTLQAVDVPCGGEVRVQPR
jgi:serine/threonine-protein kinase